jgi:hypothetical protein
MRWRHRDGDGVRQQQQRLDGEQHREHEQHGDGGHRNDDRRAHADDGSLTAAHDAV